MTASTPQDLEGRMARLEATVDSFVSTVRSQFDNTNEQFDALHSHIDGLREAIQRHDRTPWGNVIAAGTLILAIVALGAQGFIRDLSDAREKQARLEDIVTEHRIEAASVATALKFIENADHELRAQVREHSRRELERLNRSYSDGYQ